MATEEQVKLAAKLYECRDSAKTLYQDEYQEKIKWYIDVLKAVEKKEKKDTLQAAMFACELDTVKESGVAVMMFMAAACEIIEPSKN